VYHGSRLTWKSKILVQGRDPTQDPCRDRHARATKQALEHGQKQTSMYSTRAERALTVPYMPRARSTRPRAQPRARTRNLAYKKPRPSALSSRTPIIFHRRLSADNRLNTEHGVSQACRCVNHHRPATPTQPHPIQLLGQLP
jgi:hypothetical protein